MNNKKQEGLSLLTDLQTAAHGTTGTSMNEFRSRHNTHTQHVRPTTGETTLFVSNITLHTKTFDNKQRRTKDTSNIEEKTKYHAELVQAVVEGYYGNNDHTDRSLVPESNDTYYDHNTRSTTINTAPTTIAIPYSDSSIHSSRQQPETDTIIAPIVHPPTRCEKSTSSSSRHLRTNAEPTYRRYRTPNTYIRTTTTNHVDKYIYQLKQGKDKRPHTRQGKHKRKLKEER